MESIKINEMVKYQFYMIPKELFTDENYRKMSLEAKMLYSLLIDRLELSRRNNWINANGEVYLIFKRSDMESLLGLTYKTVAKAFDELKQFELVREQRQGLGKPNLIYIGKLKNETQEDTKKKILNWKISNSEVGKISVQDMENFQPNNTNINKTNKNEKGISQSVDDVGLEEIKERCELEILEETDEFGNVDTRKRQMIENAIELMYYSKSIKVGNAVIPQDIVRKRLQEINGAKICYALDKLKTNLINTKNITNSTNYLIACIYNAISEYHTDAEIESKKDYIA